MQEQEHFDFIAGKTYFAYICDVNFDTSQQNNVLVNFTTAVYFDKTSTLKTLAGISTSEYRDFIGQKIKKDYNGTITKITYAPLIPFTIPYPPENIPLADFMKVFLEEFKK